MPGNDVGTLELLVRLRVMLSGQGGLRTRDGVLEAILPGPEFSLRVEAGGHARLSYPNGRPLSTVLPVSDELAFTSLMHNVDCSIHGGPEGIPPSLALLADRLAMRILDGDAGLASLVSCGDLDMASPEGPWDAPPCAHALAEAALRSEDEDLSTAAFAFLRDVREEGCVPFDSLRSLVRWGWQTESWLNAEPSVVPASGDGTWTRIETESGVAAAARELRWLEGEVLATMAGHHANSGGSGPRRMLRRAEGTHIHVLRDGDGGLLAVATVGDDMLTVRGPAGDEADYLDDVAALRASLGLDASPLGFR